MSSSSTSRFERPPTSSSTSRVCARRLASIHSFWKRGERVNSSIRVRMNDCMPVWITGASTSARSGSTSRASEAKSISLIDRGVELVRDRLLDRGLRRDRRDRVHVAVGVEQRHPQPDRHDRQGREPAAEDQQSDRRRPADRARAGRSCAAAWRSPRAGARLRSGSGSSAMGRDVRAPEGDADHPNGMIRGHSVGAIRRASVEDHGRDQRPCVPDSPRPTETLGDRLEHAIEQRTDVAGEIEQAEPRRRITVKTVFWLAVTGISLYLVFPSVIETLGSWRDITRFSVGSLLGHGGAAGRVAHVPVGAAARRAAAPAGGRP